MTRIHSVQCALPPHYYDQKTLIGELQKYWSLNISEPSLLASFHRKVLVDGRYLALPLEEYGPGQGLGFKNDAWIRVSTDLLQEAAEKLLNEASLSPKNIHLLCSATTTGLSAPSLEARLMNRMSFPQDTKRVPLFGLGCLAGVAGINRAHDYLTGHPEEAALFLAVELCSLTLQFDDFSIPNLIGSGLFGDGAAAVLLVGDRHPLAREAKIEIENTHSVFFPDTERVMGWDVRDSGFKLVLSPEIPNIVRENIPAELGRLLKPKNLGLKDLSFYVAHPGGPKVLSALEEALELNPGELKISWDSLKTYGNMSSASVLFVLREIFKSLPPQGSWGLMSALGPAFSAELTLLKRV